jgi:GAF domain-containing protein
MLDTYGGLAAQIVTAVVSKGDVAGIISVHQLKRPRRWTEEEANACRLAAEQVAGLL